jgi:membrane protein implicated in regulation of membrane protease activity
MQEFWQLVSLLVCLAGFLITGGFLLLRGDSLLVAVIRAVISFAVLYVVQKVLGAILTGVTGSGSPTQVKPPERSEEERAGRN